MDGFGIQLLLLGGGLYLYEIPMRSRRSVMIETKMSLGSLFKQRRS